MSKGTWRHSIKRCCLYISGTLVAVVREATPTEYHWSIDTANGTSKSQYAAQRAVRKALRDVESIQ